MCILGGLVFQNQRRNLEFVRNVEGKNWPNLKFCMVISWYRKMTSCNPLGFMQERVFKQIYVVRMFYEV